MRHTILVDLDRFLLFIVDIPQRSGAGKRSLLSLFDQSFPRLFGKIVDVVLRHQYLDAVDELFVGAGVFVEDRAFFHEHKGDIQFINDNVVLKVSVETVGFLAQEDLHVGMFSQVFNHLGEVGAAGLFGGFNIYELTDNVVIVPVGVGTEELALGGDRVAFPFLLFGGNSGVEHRRRLFRHRQPSCTKVCTLSAFEFVVSAVGKSYLQKADGIFRISIADSFHKLNHGV